jgi:hypothetical protein
VWRGERLIGAIILGPSSDLWTTNDIGMLKGLVQSGAPVGRFKAHLARNPFDIKPAYIASHTTNLLLPTTVLGRPAKAPGETPVAVWARLLRRGAPRCESARRQDRRRQATACRRPCRRYAGKILRVDLTAGAAGPGAWDREMRDRSGIGLGAMILYRETATRRQGQRELDHPDNRLVLATGPLAGLPVWGTGGLTVITRGALTGGATSTQANGFFGAALKYSGYDAIVMQGQARKLSYLYINDDVVEVRDAAHLAGKDTWETQEALETEHGLAGHRLSVYSIGPAGENLVRFAAIQGDYGHVASKNGCGAVMGRRSRQWPS